MTSTAGGSKVQVTMLPSFSLYVAAASIERIRRAAEFGDSITIAGPKGLWRGRRLVQEADGHPWTVKSGEPTFVDAVDTRARPGTVVRGSQTAPTGSNAHAR